MVVKNKKIIQIVCTYPPYKGGTGTVAYNFKKYLKKLYNIDLLTLSPKYNNEFKSDENNLVFLSAWPKIGNAAFIPGIYKYLKNADVVIFHTPFFGAVETLLWYLKFANKKQKTKVLVYYHQDPLIDRGIRKYIFSFYNKFIYPKLFQRADRILVSSLDYAQHSLLTKIYEKNPDKFREVPLGVDKNQFYPISDGESLDKLRKKYNLSNNRAIITFVGGLGESHYFKGVKYLIKAISILKNRNIDFDKLVLIGRGNLIDEYKKYAQSLDVQDKMDILTNVSDEELSLFYNISWVNVLPSMDTSGEVFGLVSVEAMACKTPVITSNIVGVRTVTENNKTGFLIKAGDVNALADKLEILIKNSELRKEMGENAYQHVMNKFIWEKTVAKLKNIIDELV